MSRWTSAGRRLTSAVAQSARSALEAKAESWVADYFNVRHLLRTRDWVVALDPDAGEDLRIAALTHDIERREPGGPRLDPRLKAWDDRDYLQEHSRRSALVVGRWLADAGAPESVAGSICELIELHETGGTPQADLLQAADSLSFLEVNGGRARSWVEEGRCDMAQAQAKLDWMRDRIQVPAAEQVAASLHAQVSSELR
jgi:hypothetical protein